MSNKIFISCGEYSGEIHASHVVNELKKINSDIEIFAFGSQLLKQQGVELIADYKDASFSGISEVIQNLGKILDLQKQIIAKILEIKPSIILLVDYGGFNLKLAKAIKSNTNEAYNPIIIDFIAPQIWASRPWRINNIKRYVDLVLCTLPFEQEIYSKANINHIYVGNPVLASLKQAATKESCNFDKNEIIIGLFPGSRKSEIQYMLPIMIEASKIIKEHIPRIKFILAKAASISNETLIQNGIQKATWIEIRENFNHELLSAADFLWLCSGTVTLEAALYTTPYFLAYKSNWLNYQIYKLIKTINMAGLANIIAGKYLVKEFLQYDANVNNFVNETLGMFGSDFGFSDQYIKIKNNLIQFKQSLSGNDTYTLVAKAIIERLS